MFGDVVTSFLVVGGVNTYRNTSGHQRAIKSEEPFWCIESNDVQYRVLAHFAVEEGFGKFHTFVVVLVVVVGELSRHRDTQMPLIFVERALRMPYCLTAALNYSIRVVGWTEAIPVLAILMGNSAFISVAHRIFLAGYCGSLGAFNNFCSPSGEMLNSLAVG